MVAGFVDFEIVWRADVFSGAPLQSSAANYGTLGITFRARRASSAEEWEAAVQALSDEVSEPMTSNPPVEPLMGADDFYDAGDKGCAEGPLDEIAGRMRRLAPGQTLEVHATDPSVGVDLPPWLRLTGHELVKHENDRFLLRRKG